MQTALAVREFDYFRRHVGLRQHLLYYRKYCSWCNLTHITYSTYGLVRVILLSAWFFIPRLSKVSQQQADARAVMTGRVTDAYTNIQTVKLFAHAGRESQYAKRQ